MKRRCYDSRSDSYKYYGGKSINIYEDWLNDFETFYEWALSNGYEDDLTIDRIDSSGDYTPSNCKWSTMKEQDNNRTNNVVLTHSGIAHTIPEWSELTGIKQYVIRNRIKRGWDVDTALTRKVGKYEYKN